MAEYNAALLAELSGLSPTQAQRLLHGGWHDGPLHLADDLAPADLEGADFLPNARTLLAAIDRAGGVPATVAGNLKRALVAEMMDAMRWPEGWADTVRRKR